MSKISFKLILALLALAMKGIRAAIRAVEIIRDLMDDGQLNGSSDLPTWLDSLDTVLSEASSVVSGMTENYRIEMDTKAIDNE